jgi:predicted phosphodiesterase
VAQLRRLGGGNVLGNADAFVLDADAGAEVPTERQLEVRDWTRAQLGADGLAYVEGFEPTLKVSLGDDRALLAFHGSPGSYDDVLLPDLAEDEFRRLVGPPVADVLAGGHTHVQWLRRCGESTFVNPGSVGLGYDAQGEAGTRFDAFASYARITVRSGAIEIAFRRVPFERDAVVDAITSSGMPHADALAADWR